MNHNNPNFLTRTWGGLAALVLAGGCALSMSGCSRDTAEAQTPGVTSSGTVAASPTESDTDPTGSVETLGSDDELYYLGFLETPPDNVLKLVNMPPDDFLALPQSEKDPLLEYYLKNPTHWEEHLEPGRLERDILVPGFNPMVDPTNFNPVTRPASASDGDDEVVGYLNILKTIQYTASVRDQDTHEIFLNADMASKLLASEFVNTDINEHITDRDGFGNGYYLHQRTKFGDAPSDTGIQYKEPISRFLVEKPSTGTAPCEDLEGNVIESCRDMTLIVSATSEVVKARVGLLPLGDTMTWKIIGTAPYNENAE